jgi:hypothetical protein
MVADVRKILCSSFWVLHCDMGTVAAGAGAGVGAAEDDDDDDDEVDEVDDDDDDEDEDDDEDDDDATEDATEDEEANDDDDDAAAPCAAADDAAAVGPEVGDEAHHMALASLENGFFWPMSNFFSTLASRRRSAVTMPLSGALLLSSPRLLTLTA